MDQTHIPLKKLPPDVLHHHCETLLPVLKEWHTQKKTPPVLLLTGQPGIGKRLIAHFLSQAISCQQSDSSKVLPCNQCPSCLRSLEGQRVDLTEITPEADENTEGSKLLRAEQFRNLKNSMGFGAHESRFRTIIIPGAERMTPQAANSVLKLLEEPPPGWIFYLTVHDSSLLLPTLVSRCQILRLKPLPAEKIEKLLKSSATNPAIQDSERRKICAILSQGSWDRALEFAQDEVWEQRKVLFQFLQEPTAILQSLVDWASTDAHRFHLLIDLLEQLVAEFIRWSVDPQKPWTQSDAQEALTTHAQKVTRHFGDLAHARIFWLERIEDIVKARQESTAPLNRKLLVQNILFPWIGVTP